MAQLKPFGALRFTEKAGEISQLCCPPYDIISEDERLAYIARNQHNIIRLELPREGEDCYATAGETLRGFLAEGTLKTDDAEGLYIYGERFTVEGKEYEFKGIIGRVHIEEFSKGIVLPHEETLSKAKADRFNLMNATMCNFSQIYSLYNDDGGVTTAAIDRLSAGEPVQCFTDGDGVTHSLWIVTDKDECDALCKQFDARKLYIADGHHRYETSINFRNHLRQQGIAKEGDACDFVMMMLVAMESDGLVVFPTHRIVRGVENYNEKDVLSACEKSFDIAEQKGADAILPALKAAYEQNKTAFAFYVGADKWYMLTLKDTAELDAICSGCSDALKGLDVNVLHTLVLERAMGIDKENMAKQINLTYTRNADEAISAVDSGEANCSFIMNPTRVSEIRDVAAAGEKMPQKSTYFYPKLITGLVMNKFGEI